MQRTPTPKVLEKNAIRWSTALKTVRSNPDATNRQVSDAQNKYRHPSVKNALVKMFSGKCAYCESKITVVTYGAIEHFYPKSKYIDLTFEWNNLLLSCDVCNDASHKGAKFPVDSHGEPLLIDPADGVTDPKAHLDLVWDSITGLAGIYGRDERDCTVETVFDLNGIHGRKELIAHRSSYVKRLFALLRFARQGDPEAISLLQECLRPSAEYSAFALIYIQPHLS